MQTAVFLDRDGVINEESPEYVKSVSEWRPIPGSLEAIARLSRSGRNVVILTNQSGLGRGLFDVEALDAIHDRLTRGVEDLGGRIRAILICPHTPADGCHCRKPASGLLERAERELGLPLRGMPMIGDRATDLEAGRAVGCDPILVRTGHGQTTARSLGPASGVRIYADLAAAADTLLGG